MRKSIGKFILALRKEKNLTQKDLATILNVSDKTVSRWECEETMPDLTLIPEIANYFDITIDELLRGERTKFIFKGNSSNSFLDNKYLKFTNLNLVTISLSIISLLIAILCNSVFLNGPLGFWLSIILIFLSTIFEIFLINNYYIRSNGEYLEYNNKIIIKSIKIFVLNILIIAFLLPIPIVVGNRKAGLNDLLIHGTLSLVISSIILFLLYTIFIKPLLIKNGLIYLNEKEISVFNHKRKLTIKLLLINIGVIILGIISYLTIPNLLTERDFKKDSFELKFETYEDFKSYIELSENGYQGLLRTISDDKGNPILFYYRNNQDVLEIHLSDDADRLPIYVTVNENVFNNIKQERLLEYQIDIVGCTIIAICISVLSTSIYGFINHKKYRKLKNED